VHSVDHGSFIATMVANALVVSPTMGWIRLWVTVRIGRRIQGDLRRCEGDFVDYCEDNIEIKSRGRSGELVLCLCVDLHEYAWISVA
jgi:hypothetical protein